MSDRHRMNLTDKHESLWWRVNVAKAWNQPLIMTFEEAADFHHAIAGKDIPYTGPPLVFLGWPVKVLPPASLELI